MKTAEPTITIRARVTDLQADDCGWMENGCWATERDIVVPVSWSDTRIARRIKRELGIVGMRKDYWCGGEWCWRSGCVGAYADVVS